VIKILPFGHFGICNITRIMCGIYVISCYLKFILSPLAMTAKQRQSVIARHEAIFLKKRKHFNLYKLCQ
ncbi:MAG: hypothetical protein LBN23_00270, partial [Paludibacter sp.]|nr:hypothetical protein [Paludibacter sp.]